MSNSAQIRHLQALRETEANRQGQIDQQIKNLQANLMDEVARNAGAVAVHGAGVRPPK